MGVAADPGARWAARPWRARLLRALVYLCPIAGSIGFVQGVTALTGAPTGSLAAFLVWWFALSIAATGVVSVTYMLSRRLLPLGALLELSLVFPDEAPSRFRLALRTGTVEELQRRLRELGDSRRATDPQAAAELLLQLVAALDVHDRVTRGHAERVRGYAAALGRQLGFTGDDLDRLNWAALLHDIGKLEVSSEILNKPGRPTDDEWQSLRRHPLAGETLVEPLRAWLGPWADAVGYHHESWDGTGYPRGVCAEEIPLAGRIVAIADVYDVITSTRSYKEPATPTAARAEIVRCSGAQFDPRLVRAFVAMSLGRMRLVLGPLSWLSNLPLLARVPLTPSLGAALGGVAALGAAAAAGGALPQTAASAGPLRVAAPVVGGSAAQPVVRRVPVVTHRRPGRTTARGAPHDPAPGLVPAARRPAGTATDVPPQTASPAGGPAATTPAAVPSAPDPTTPRPVPPPVTTTTTTPASAPPTSTPAAPPPPPTAPAVNQAPSFAAGASQSVPEDAGAQSIAGWASAISPGPTSESSQSVSFAIGNDRPALFSAQPALSAGGTLTYTPAPNANGTATVTVTARDNGGTANGGSDTSAAQTFTIAVTPVNDAPSFSAGGNQTAVSLLGAVTVSGWATAISAGPADEAAQVVTFAVSVDKPALFSVPPAVAPDGTLTYKPKALAAGVVTVTVRAVDSGGTASGGVDSSVDRTFTITIV